MNNQKGYVYIRTPGQVCERCGRDNSDRASGTKHCYDCSKEISKLNAAARRVYLTSLEARDKAMKPNRQFSITEPHCPACNITLFGLIMHNLPQEFCSACGQRLDWSRDDE